MPFNALGLLPELTRALADRNYLEPTPVQARVIPEILAGRDILAGAQTGTGKTAGFALPLLQLLQAQQNPSRAPRALILVPTRELAAQVAESIRTYGKYLRLRTTLIFGGVSINPQIEALRRGCDIVVATPGRLLDHAQQGTVDLKHVEILVLDEADRMLDMGFIADIRRVIKQLPPKRQNLMFSATYSDDIRKLAQSLLRDPVEVEVARRNAAVESVEQHVYQVPKDQKRALLSHLIKDGNWPQVLVFTRTKHGANRLAKQLEQDGIRSAAIHGNKSQSARTQALADFKNSRVQALVATEVAARGLDIKELPHVVNYELPNVPEDYVHRIGRTGRAGATGIAVSLVASDERDLLRDIERLLRKTVTQQPLPTFAPAPPPLREHEERYRDPRAQQQRHHRGGQGDQRNDGNRQRGRGNAQRPAGSGQTHSSQNPNAQRANNGEANGNRAPQGRQQQNRQPGNHPAQHSSGQQGNRQRRFP